MSASTWARSRCARSYWVDLVARVSEAIPGASPHIAPLMRATSYNQPLQIQHEPFRVRTRDADHQEALALVRRQHAVAMPRFPLQPPDLARAANAAAARGRHFDANILQSGQHALAGRDRYLAAGARQHQGVGFCIRIDGERGRREAFDMHVVFGPAYRSLLEIVEHRFRSTAADHGA